MTQIRSIEIKEKSVESFFEIYVIRERKLYTATLIIAMAVIPAPYQVRGKLQQESRRGPCGGREPLLKKHWIPPYQVRGRLSQARNDKRPKTYVHVYTTQGF